MGWLQGKKLIIKPAAGAAKSFDDEPHHMQGRRLLVDVSGVLHKAKRRQGGGNDRHQFRG